MKNFDKMLFSIENCPVPIYNNKEFIFYSNVDVLLYISKVNFYVLCKMYRLGRA